MKERPKIMFVTALWPRPVACGGQERAVNICRLLSQVGNVSLAVVTPWPADGETLRLNMREFDVRMAIRALPVARGSLVRKFQWRVQHEVRAASMASDPYAISRPDRAALLDLLQEFDVVWVQGVKTADFCRIGRWPHSVLDTVDVMSNLYRTKAQRETNSLRRKLDMRLSWIWKRRERLFAERFDVVTVCSEDERKLLGLMPRVHVMPNGFNPEPVRRSPSIEMPRIGFIGSFRWGPNKDGAEWFVRDVWPLIKSKLPQVQLRLVGAGTEGCFGEAGQGVAGLGWLDNPGEEISTWSAMVVPIRFGAGTRVKMAEGFARKCPIVATTTGAFGYSVHDREEFLLADDAGDFASACIRLVRDPELGKSLADRAYRRFLREWSWESQGGKIRAVIRECLARNDRPRVDEAAAVRASHKSGTGRV